ncbi:MAG: UDP-N-acetylmuramoyl-L-alanyl-D-glutamate--2,6-diaminopimelate ligase [Parcubacteria group bacterium]
MKKLIKKLMPKFILSGYHKFLAVFSAFVYGHPSEKMTVIGVTGTNGKSTTVWLIAKALESSGLKVGATSTVLFKVADKEWLNDKKMTMLGRFQLQKLLKRMVDAGCKYAVIEVSSEGIKQYRHIGINFDYAVFTNLTPEHIESHGGFENYKKAKGELFKHLKNQKNKKSSFAKASEDGLKNQEIKKTTIINIDDEHSSYFLDFPAEKKITFGIEKKNADFMARDIAVSLAGTSFEVSIPSELDQVRLRMKIIGAFNVYNALPAIAIGLNEGISIENIKSGLEKVTNVPGRMEFISEGQPFTVIVDYAPEPASMAKLYETVKQLIKNQEINKSINQKNETSKEPVNQFPPKADAPMAQTKIIHVLGSCGGGRDKARRPILGKMAGENADIVIVTNEDPYDDDPMQIINEVADGALSVVSEKNRHGINSAHSHRVYKILDRKEAIEKALSLAQAGNLVLITGKGAEQRMAVAGGRYIPWDDREIVREYLRAN